MLRHIRSYADKTTAAVEANPTAENTKTIEGAIFPEVIPPDPHYTAVIAGTCVAMRDAPAAVNAD